jgi:hypothetical protein
VKHGGLSITQRSLSGRRVHPSAASTIRGEPATLRAYRVRSQKCIYIISFFFISMGICYICGKEIDMPFRCPLCNLTFCEEHRLPENHNCIGLSDRSWKKYRKFQQGMREISREKQKRWLKPLIYLLGFGILIIIAFYLFYLGVKPM